MNPKQQHEIRNAIQKLRSFTRHLEDQTKTLINVNLKTIEDAANEPEGAVTNPTGGELRIDPIGSGEFAARRGHRFHYGEDYEGKPGQYVQSPISGVILRELTVYGGEPWKGIEILAEDESRIVRLLYVKLTRHKNAIVKEGELIGKMQDISQKYGPKCKPHVHYMEFKRPVLHTRVMHTAKS